jgi:hypothetical protein
MLRPPHPRLDGNAAAGILAEVFGRDMTLAGSTCRHCGRRGVVAQAIVELDDQGVILLCRSCGHTLLTAVRFDDAWSLALPGCAELRVPADEMSSGSAGDGTPVP